MELFLLSAFNSVANNFVAELRDINIQGDGMRFRKNMERIGEILAYEISKDLEYKKVEVKTPLGESTVSKIREDPYLITIMRAGIPFYQGFLNYFETSDSGFIGAFRSDYDQNKQFDIDMGYMAIGDIRGKEIILIDPMLATGKSVIKAVDQIVQYGIPKKFHIAALIASRTGYEYVRENMSVPAKFWIAAMDDKLNDNSYIVPGLGDAGDLSYGKKS